jgi:hypothetical protein
LSLRIQRACENSSYAETAKVQSNLPNPYQTPPNNAKADSYAVVEMVRKGQIFEEE